MFYPPDSPDGCLNPDNPRARYVSSLAPAPLVGSVQGGVAPAFWLVEIGVTDPRSRIFNWFEHCFCSLLIIIGSHSPVFFGPRYLSSHQSGV